MHVEVELLARIARGDQGAFADFYDRLNRPVYSLLLRMLGGHAPEAEEVLQDVFLEVWRQAADYDPARARPFSWVIVKARSRALDRLRWRARRPDHVPVGDATNPAADDGVPASAHDGSWCATERTEALQAVFDQLPAAQRTPIHLAFFLGLTHAEIAAHLGQPLGTVKAHIRRGLARMRDGFNQPPSSPAP